MPRLSHALPLAVIVFAFGGFLLTLDRSPVAWGDSVLYASVTRSLATTNLGTPSVEGATSHSVDHMRFYGPVFFGLMQVSFELFGFSLASARLVSLLGALLVTASGVLTVRALGGGSVRQLCAAALLLLTPELGFSATNGRMDSLAVGLAMLALALFVRGLARGTATLAHAVASGLLLGAAALTTPRALPFVAAFVIGGGAYLLIAGPAHRARLPMLGAAAAACGGLLCAWTIEAHGGPLSWIRYLAAIVPAVGVDVALAPAAVRDWQVRPWRVLTALAAVAGFGVAIAGRWRDRGDRSDRALAASFALAVTAVNFAAVMLAFNLTFIYATYFAVPLLAVVMALPPARLPMTRSTLRTAFVVFLAAAALVRAGKYGGVALTWAARDPEAIERFVDAHVPDGSDVMGEVSLYFYAVERSGARMLRASQDTHADWAAWAPRGVNAPPPVRAAATSDTPAPRRYFIWPADEVAYAPPAEYACADRNLVGLFEPPPSNIEWLGPFASYTGTPGYPASRLYELGPSCPSAGSD